MPSLNVPPEIELIEATAIELGVDPSFVEKDWYAMRLVATVANTRHGGLAPVFSGGTSLSKGFGLIQRFSEDLDFKVLLPEAGIGRRERRAYRNAIVEAIRADDDWVLRDGDVATANATRFFCCHVGYPTTAAVAEALRPRLKLEMTLRSPLLRPEERSLHSFVSQALGENPEIPRISCVAPAETAADKLSALTWRVLDPGTRHDPTLVRHVHDLAALEQHTIDYQGFPGLLRQLLDADAARADAAPEIAALPAADRLANALEILDGEPEHAARYGNFVRAMCYGNEDETPTFEDALEAVRRLGQRMA